MLFYFIFFVFSQRETKRQMTKESKYLLLQLCLIFFIFIPFKGHGEMTHTLPYRIVNTFRTSPSDENRRLFSDHFGLLWIGTSSGLKSYDGYSLHTIKSTADHPNVLPHNTVLNLTEDHHNHLFIGTRNGIVKLDEQTGNISSYPNITHGTNLVTMLYTSHDGQVWMGDREGLLRYDPVKDRFERFDASNSYLIDLQGKKHRMNDYDVCAITENSRGELFIGSWYRGVLRFDPRKRLFYAYPHINERQSAYSLFFDSRHRLWIGTWGFGLQRMDNPDNRNHPKLHTYFRGKGSFDAYYKIIEDPVTHTIWAGSREGINIIGLDDDFSKIRYYNSYQFGFTYPLPFCNDLITDERGNIYIETLYDGIIHVNTVPSPFHKWNLRSSGYNLTVNSVCSIFTEDGRKIWLTMKPYGIACYNRSIGKALFNGEIPGFSGLPDDFLKTSITSIARRYNGELWFADNSYGIGVYKVGKPVTILRINDYPQLVNNYIQTLLASRDHTMWVGQRSGISVFYPDNQCIALTMREYGKDISNCAPQQIMEDHNGTKWVATDNEGIIRIKGDIFHPSTLRFHQYGKDQHNFSVNDATACYEDSRHRIWAISNSGGLFKYNQRTDKFESMNNRYHIPGDRIFTIQEDAHGNLWLSTDNALICFPSDNTIQTRIFGEENGLSDIFFYPNSSFRYGNELFLACRNGYFCFAPTHLNTNRKKQNIRIIVSDILINDKPLEEIDSAQRVSISTSLAPFTHQLKIPAGQNKVALKVALLSYNNEQAQYAYQLEGQDKSWKVLNNGHHIITFENLPAGTYTLHLQASDSHGNIYKLPYDITIIQQPHWYASSFAICVYILLIVSGFWLGSRWYRNHLKIENQLQMGVIFTNITHDLLTPLTIISSIVEIMRQKVPQLEDNYKMIQDHIVRINRMLRQILEVRKDQAGQLKLLTSKDDWSMEVRKICESLRPMEMAHNNTLVLNIPDQPVEGWIDNDKLEKILYNLLSNAFKYSQEGGTVTVQLRKEDKNVVLSVLDQGTGITEEKFKHLYTRFLDGDYRRMKTEGTGIGLSLTYDLVRLHHGTIDCKSKAGEGTVFTITFPLSASAYSEKERDKKTKQPEIFVNTESEAQLKVIGTSRTKRPKDAARILIVEDNAELLTLMKTLLEKDYQILTAANGQQAWNMIQREELDLIISDVMMPVMDGIQLTKKIKNSDFSPLPVILLTAKTSEADKDAGIQCGADDYIVKPFRFESLRLHINNLLENRSRFRNVVQQQTQEQQLHNHQSKTAHLTSPDELFISRAEACVMKHLADPEYSREEFAKEMLVSPSTLFKKLRTLTGKNIVEFITEIRLREAKRIIHDNPYIKLSEVALQVGFNTSKYMNYCFKKYFGLSPRSFAEQVREKL